jgi:hypothetical protein
MNFGKLLGAGRCFISGRGTAAYRENKHVYLPKFNSVKNPFVPKPAEQDSAAEAGMKKAAAPAAMPAEAKVMTKVAAKTQKISTFPASAPVRATTWAEKLNPFRTPPPVAPPLLPQVQPELSLSLDAVKVVHNDLSDADVEVVPMKSRTVTPAAMPAGLPAGLLSEHRLNAV